MFRQHTLGFRPADRCCDRASARIVLATMGRATCVAFACAVLVVAGSSGDRTSQAQQALTTCVTLDAAGDTFVVEHHRHHNFGARPHLRAGDHHESLVQFDLGAIPASAAIDTATFGVYVV